MTGYTLSDGRTLKNKLGADNLEQLDVLEGPYLAYRYAEIKEGGGPTGAFGLDRFKATHHHLFQNVYAWAGHTLMRLKFQPRSVQ